MKRTVSISTGWMKLPAPPVDQSAKATNGLTITVAAARAGIGIVYRRTPSQIDTQPHANENPAAPSAAPMWILVVPGSARAISPKIAVATHITPEVRSGSGPSPRSWSMRRDGSGILAREGLSHFQFRAIEPQH